MTKTEREAFAKNLYEEYNDTECGQISYESLGYRHNKATSTIHRLINQHKDKLAGDE